MECSVCGISGEKARLLDVISSKGIVKVCEQCAEIEDMPVFRRPTTFQLKEAEKKPIIYSREPEKKPEETKTEITLKEIADRNYEKTISQEKKPSPDLVDNFHWIVMRTRRMKKLTQEQLAGEISESTAAIKMAEKGILPEDDYRLVNKLESFLGIKIVKDEARDKLKEIPEKQPARILKFDMRTMQDLTIADLKKIKGEKEKPEEDLEEKEEEDTEEAEVL
jgi:ribosome-binding protein aMBF1 (putative translation factor)